MRARQTKLFAKLPPPERAYGGDLVRGHRKKARPFSRRATQHLVMRSSRARGPLSMRRKNVEGAIEVLVYAAAKLFGVKLYAYANSGTHLHFLARARDRYALANFLRMVGGRVAEVVTGARKGEPVGQFWDCIAYSRVVAWGRDFLAVRLYIEQNVVESHGLVAYRPRGRYAGPAASVGLPGT
jgi:hypothetical protein